MAGGLPGLGLSLGGWLVGCALFLPWFLLRGMGAGDVKLLAALGAWLGPRDALWIALLCRPGRRRVGVVVTLVDRVFRHDRSEMCGDC